MIKKTFKFFLLLTVIILIGYTVFTTIVKIKSDEFALVIDKRSNYVVMNLTSGWNFVKDAIIPNKILIKRVKKTGNESFKLNYSLPQLKSLNDENYSIIYPIEYQYKIDQLKLNLLNTKFDTNFINKKVLNIAIKAFEEVITNNLKKGYDPVLILKRWSIIEDKFFASVKENSKNYGIKITNIKKFGALNLPKKSDFKEGLKYLEQISNLKKQYELEKLKTNSQIEKQNKQNLYYYEHLEKMAVLIKENPDLLKYIYIDKLAGNKHINPLIGKTGYPMFMKTKNISKPVNEKEDIDNFQ